MTGLDEKEEIYTVWAEVLAVLEVSMVGGLPVLDTVAKPNVLVKA